MDQQVPLFEIPYGEDVVQNATNSIRRGSHWANGPFISEFEDGLEEYFGVEHAVTVNSGTSALVTALEAHEIGSGDEVIVPSFSFIATANAVKLAGAEPRFVDIERDTYGIDPNAVTEAITPDTAAILPAHLYGGACKIEALTDIALKNDITLIEDAAESMGADFDGRLLGTFGDSAALSFCQNKIVPTGEGGAILTDDREVARKARLFRSHGRTSTAYFDSPKGGEYAVLGGNLRMPDIVAAIGCSQLEEIESHIARRREAAEQMNEAFLDLPGIEPHASPRGRHVYQLYTVTLGRDIERETVIEMLTERGVASKIYWDTPIHLTEYYRSESDRASEASLPVTEEISSRVLSLPIYPTMSDADIETVIEGTVAALTEQKQG